jgi:hypothetical protein
LWIAEQHNIAENKPMVEFILSNMHVDVVVGCRASAERERESGCLSVQERHLFSLFFTKILPLIFKANHVQ